MKKRSYFTNKYHSKKFLSLLTAAALAFSSTGWGSETPDISSSEAADQEQSSLETGSFEKPGESDGTAPEKPGEPDETAPEKPGESDGTAPGKPGESDGTAPEKPGEPGEMAPGAGGPGGQTWAGSYEAVNEYTETVQVSDETLASTGTDENAVLVDGETALVTLEGVAVTRTSADSTGGDNSSFYGVGAAALVTEGVLSLKNSTISSDAAGGAGVFAYGDGTAYVSDTVIQTTQDTSGGIHVAGGGTLYAWNLNVETEGESSAAIRSDRGSGTMVVDGGTYISNGIGSPAVYSTADITVHEGQLTANGSEAICIEGRNTIRLFDCELSGNMSDLDQNDCTWNVILYQSMSGDSQVGNSTFQMTGGSLTAGNGGMFYTTNTESTFFLSNVKIVCAEDSEFFLKCTGNSNERGWGTQGDNGADCSFTASEQVMEGDICWDSISNLDFYMVNGSTLTGAAVQDESCAGSGGEGYANIWIDETSTWFVTGDSTVTALANAGLITDTEGRTVSVLGSDGTVYVEGTSPYTITAETYTDSPDFSGASQAEEWSSFAAEQI